MKGLNTNHAVIDIATPGCGSLRINARPMPRSVAHTVVRALCLALHAVPRDLRELHVCYNPDDSEHIAGFTARQEYRSGTLHICPGFLASTEDEQLTTILHEFAHYYGDHMDRVFCDAANRFITDESARGFVYDQVKHAHEIIAEDIAQLHYRLISGSGLPPLGFASLIRQMDLAPEEA